MPSDDLVGDARFLGVLVYGITPRVAMWDQEYPSAIWTDTTREGFTEESRGRISGILRRLKRWIRQRLHRCP